MIGDLKAEMRLGIQIMAFELVAKVEAEKARIEGMKVFNEMRKSQGLALGYGDNDFGECADNLEKYANELGELWKTVLPRWNDDIEKANRAEGRAQR